MNNKNLLLDLREKISILDEKILILLAERKKLAINVAHVKITMKKKIRDTNRERILLKKLIQVGKKYKLNPDYITYLFQKIIEDSVLTQQTLVQKKINPIISDKSKISFLGPKGSYSHIAANQYAKKYLNKYIENSCEKFDDVVNQVQKGNSDYAILPIFNTNSGFIHDVHTLLTHTNLSLIGEIYVCINHCLLISKKTNLEKIKVVYSHTEPFKQCSNFIKQFPHWKIKYTKSTALAMQKISQLNTSECAAIGGAQGGKFYQLKVLKNDLANQSKNTTRFIILASKPINISHQIPAKTTLIVTVSKKIECLQKILLILDKYHINMNILELKSNNWHLKEIFYLDLDANVHSDNMKKVLHQLSLITFSVKILGCYPNEKFNPIHV